MNPLKTKVMLTNTVTPFTGLCPFCNYDLFLMKKQGAERVYACNNAGCPQRGEEVKTVEIYSEHTGSVDGVKKSNVIEERTSGEGFNLLEALNGTWVKEYEKEND